MHISRIFVENFRNFHCLEVDLSQQAVIVGENKVGKTNLLYALRLVLDHTLPDSKRELRKEDFWEGIEQPLALGTTIRVEVDVTEFEHDENLIAILADHLVQATPHLVARLTYVFQPHPSGEKDSHGLPKYEFRVFGGGRQENVISSEVRRYLPLRVLPALRDAESDLESWRNSPLRPLIDNLQFDEGHLKAIAAEIDDASKKVAGLKEVTTLNKSITTKMVAIAGRHQGVQTSLGLLPSEPDKLVRSLRLFIEGSANRTMTEASLGTANLLYLTLLDLEISRQTFEKQRYHTFLGIEEPEAHLHPQLQRLVFRAFLQERNTLKDGPHTAARSVLLTTLSPYIVSVTPLRSFVLLKDTKDGTKALSTAKLELEETEVADLERYIDATRGELLFARGVILVEGMGEAILLPALAQKIGINLDEEGISVCSINGTHFTSYVRFLEALSIPWAVITDMDPDTRTPGDRRIARIYHQLTTGPSKLPASADIAGLAASAKEAGLFVGEYTFEIDLFKAGLSEVMREVLIELDDGEAIASRTNDWKPDDLIGEKAKGFLADIEAISKGRFAQRLAQKIPPDCCPDYIREAIKHVSTRIRKELSRTIPRAAGGVEGEPSSV